VYNPTANIIDMQGYTVKDNDGQQFIISGVLNVPAGGYAVLGNNDNPVTNGGVVVNYEYPSAFTFDNNGDELIILDLSGTEVDRLVWTPSFDSNGRSSALVNPCTDNSVLANWCTSDNMFSGSSSDRGTPGAANDCN